MSSVEALSPIDSFHIDFGQRDQGLCRCPPLQLTLNLNLLAGGLQQEVRRGVERFMPGVQLPAKLCVFQCGGYPVRTAKSSIGSSNHTRKHSIKASLETVNSPHYTKAFSSYVRFKEYLKSIELPSFTTPPISSNRSTRRVLHQDAQIRSECAFKSASSCHASFPVRLQGRITSKDRFPASKR